MAKKETTEKPALERTYVIPLRKVYQRAPRWKRTPRAVKAVREFIVKHMKAADVKIGKHLNLLLWKDGMKNPPHKVEVECVKDKDAVVTVEMVGAPKEVKKEEKKPAKKAASKDDKKKDVEVAVKDALSGKEEETKKNEKEELKTIKKEKIPVPKEAAAPKQVQQQPNAPASKG
jgi:large subunit ribosomal protein L31e